MARILLADDDANLRGTLVDALRAKGHTVDAVTNGQEVVDAINGGMVPQLVVLDALLPKLSGFDAAKNIRQAGYKGPLIFISGILKTAQHKQDAKEKLGAVAYLLKPFNIDELTNLCAMESGTATRPAAQVHAMPKEGDLVAAPVLHLLWRAFNEGHTGVLDVMGTHTRGRVFVYKGRPTMAQSSDADANIGAEALRAALIDVELYHKYVSLAMERRNGLYQVLLKEEVADEATLKECYRSLIPRVLGSLVAATGRFQWQDGDRFSQHIPTVPISLLDALPGALKRSNTEDLDAHVRPRSRLILGPGPAWDDVAGLLDSTCGSSTFAREIDGRKTIDQLLLRADGERDRVQRLRQAYLLMCTQGVQASQEPLSGAMRPLPAQRDIASPETPRHLKGGRGSTEGRAISGEGEPQRSPAAVVPGSSLPGSAASTSKPSTVLPGSGSSGASKSGASSSMGSMLPGAVGPAVAPVHAPRPTSDVGIPFKPDEVAARERISSKFALVREADYWSILGLPKGASKADVKKAYFALAKDFHADQYVGLNLGTARETLDALFNLIQEANTVLSNDEKRAEYEAAAAMKEQGLSQDIGEIFEAENNFSRGKVLLDRGEIIAAHRLFQEAIRVSPNNREWHGYAVYAAWWEKRNPKDVAFAVNELEKTFKLMPARPDFAYFAAHIAFETGDAKRARINLKRCIEVDEKHVHANRLSRLLQKKMEDEQKKAQGVLGRFFKS